MNSELQKLVSAAKLSNEDALKLSSLEPGAACQHKSWGYGKIAEWDLLGDRVLIDFETKSGHPMKLSFAAESLISLPADHLLAKRVTDPVSLQKLAKEKPGDIVEMALKSNGGKLHLDDLEKMVTPKIVETGAYKKWWDNAKKELKTYRHVVVPAKRADPLILRAQDEKAGAIMVRDLQSARDLRGKIRALDAIAKDLDLFENAAEELQPAFLDITIVARKSWKLQLKDTLQLLLSRDEIRDQTKAGLPTDSITVEDIMRENRGQLAEVANGLPVGLLGRFYAAFPKAFPEEAWVKDALGHLTRTGGRAVDEITELLDANGALDVLVDFLKKSVRNRTLSTDLLVWMCKERKAIAEPVFDIDLGNAIISALEDDHIAGGPKRTARLADAFADDKTLLGEMVSLSSDEDLRLLAKRILSTSVFDELTRRSMMGKIIKARPEMEKVMEDSSEAKSDTSLIVSWPSLEKRKAELDDILTVKIPQNKKDIQIAREYGDLRENFEYKSAREQQRVLQNMKARYEADLRRAQGTDFAGVPTDKVGIGTVVEILDLGSNAHEEFSILGAWDSEPEKGVISYLSETGKSLISHGPGEEVELQTDGGSRKVKIISIKGYKA